MEINESLKQFLEKLAQDEELQAKMEAAASPEEAYAIASAVQSGFSKEEFVETMTAIKKQTSDELSDEDLEQVAGGKFNWSKFTDILSKVTETVSRTATAAAKAAL